MSLTSLPRDFIRAWQAWVYDEGLFDNFRLRRTHAPTYMIEHDLDHMASHLYAVGLNVIAHDLRSAPEYAVEELGALAAIETELNACPVAEAEKVGLRNFISATRSLLQEIAKLSPAGNMN